MFFLSVGLCVCVPSHPHRFISIEMKSVKFENSLFEDCRFEDIKSTDTVFENCTIRSTAFYNTGRFSWSRGQEELHQKIRVNSGQRLHFWWVKSKALLTGPNASPSLSSVELHGPHLNQKNVFTGSIFTFFVCQWVANAAKVGKKWAPCEPSFLCQLLIKRRQESEQKATLFLTCLTTQNQKDKQIFAIFTSYSVLDMIQCFTIRNHIDTIAL